MKTLIVLIITFLLSGCAAAGFLGDNLVPTGYTADTDLMQANRDAARSLLDKQETRISKNKSIISTTFANLDNLEQTTPMGRLISEQIATELTRQGYQMVELRVRQDEVLVEERRGEFVLTRDSDKLMQAHNAQAFLVGTYSVASNTLFVTSKLINPNDNTVINAHTYDLPLGPNALALLNRTLRPSTPARDTVPSNEEWYEQQVIKDDDIVAF